MKSIAIKNLKPGDIFLRHEKDSDELRAWILLGVHETYNDEKKTPRSYWAESRFTYGYKWPWPLKYPGCYRIVDRLGILKYIPKRSKYLINLDPYEFVIA